MGCPVCGERPTKCWCDEDDLKRKLHELHEERESWEQTDANLRSRLAAADALADRLGEALEEVQEPGVFGEPFLSAPDPIVAPLILPVCEQIGYGAVMGCAAHLWTQKDPAGAISLAACNAVRTGVLRKIRAALAAWREARGGRKE